MIRVLRAQALGHGSTLSCRFGRLTRACDIRSAPARPAMMTKPTGSHVGDLLHCARSGRRRCTSAGRGTAARPAARRSRHPPRTPPSPRSAGSRRAYEAHRERLVLGVDQDHGCDDVLVHREDERQQRDDREDRRDEPQDDREEDARVAGAVDLRGLVDRRGIVLKNPYMRYVFTPSAPPRYTMIRPMCVFRPIAGNQSPIALISRKIATTASICGNIWTRRSR